jgi:hypothetical protein
LIQEAQGWEFKRKEAKKGCVDEQAVGSGV